MWAQRGAQVAEQQREGERPTLPEDASILRKLLFEHPGDRIAAYISAASSSLRVREQIREVLYGEFYSWAHARKDTAFNPNRFVQVLPYLHVRKPDLPESRIIIGFCEFLANPASGGDIPGAGLDRKVAQQLVRPALRLAEYLWQRSSNGASEEGTDFDDMLRTLKAADLEDFLFLERENAGTSARDRASSALRKWFIPYLHTQWQGTAPELFDSIFGRLDAPATPFSRGYRAHLLQLAALPNDGSGHIAQGTAFNRDAIMRRYVEFVWDRYCRPQSLETKATPTQASALLQRLLTVDPHERVDSFILHAIDGDPEHDTGAKTRREKFSSGIRLLYQWARGAGLTEYDYDRPGGVWSDFRTSLAHGTPSLSVFDGYCDFLSGQVQLGEKFEKHGLKRSTAQNYRRAVAHFLEAAWQDYATQHTDSPELLSAAAFEAEFSAQLDVHLSHYLGALSEELSADEMKGLRSMLGIFKDWMTGSRTESGRRTASAQEEAGHSPLRSREPSENTSLSTPAPSTPASGQITAPPQQLSVLPEPVPSQIAPARERRKPLEEPRLAAILQARNQAVDALIGRGRGAGLVDFSHLCQLRMVDFDATRGTIWVPDNNNKKSPAALDVDQRAILSEYVRLLQNSATFRQACITNGRNGPLFLSADGGSLVVRDSTRTVAPLPELAHILTLQDSVITWLIRSAEQPFGRLIDFVLPVQISHQHGTFHFSDRFGKGYLVEAPPNEFRRLRELLDSIQRLPPDGDRRIPVAKSFVFVGVDGKKLTGDE